VNFRIVEVLLQTAKRLCLELEQYNNESYAVVTIDKDVIEDLPWNERAQDYTRRITKSFVSKTQYHCP
jgi:hypothetical protein